MLYVDLAINKEDMLSDRERKMPSIIRNLIYFFRKTIGQVLKYKINGKYIKEKYNIEEGPKFANKLHEERVKWLKEKLK